MPAITVPRLGWSMEEGTFVRWLKQPGDSVRVGEPLFELESDKSTEAVEAIDAGVLWLPEGMPKPGDTVKVGQLLGLLIDEHAMPDPPVPPIAYVPVTVTKAEPVAENALSAKGKRRDGPTSSPRARRAAREMGIDWRVLHGSGRGGRIRERDVRLSAVGAETEGRLVARTSTRQIIAARMLAGVNQAAPVTLTTKVDMTDLVARRAEPGDAPSYTAFVISAVALALRDHPALRTQWREDGLFIPERLHIAFAVDTDTGLLAPVVRDADRLHVANLSRICQTLAAQARAGQLPSESMRGAVFTVSNLGMYGVDVFTPIINLPQCAVLGVGRIVREPACVEDRIVARDHMTLSLTFDHRVTDGAPAARFLDTVRGFLERPNFFADRVGT